MNLLALSGNDALCILGVWLVVATVVWYVLRGLRQGKR